MITCMYQHKIYLSSWHGLWVGLIGRLERKILYSVYEMAASVVTEDEAIVATNDDATSCKRYKYILMPSNCILPGTQRRKGIGATSLWNIFVKKLKESHPKLVEVRFSAQGNLCFLQLY